MACACVCIGGRGVREFLRACREARCLAWQHWGDRLGDEVVEFPRQFPDEGTTP